MDKRRCIYCGKDISYRPSHHFLCFECWKSENSSYLNGRYDNDYDEEDDDYDIDYCNNDYEEDDYDNDYSNNYYDDEDDYRSNRNSGYNDTYYERYCGDSEYDMGPDWDYDEYPPENL